ncbi:MAG: FAD:protein FMN transferase [Planctomycetaceae bacterium]|nr:FAD:protein FMN transferase [Planctomycetaceae bacterium]
MFAFQRYEFQSVQMGVPVNIVLYADDTALAKQASDAAFETFKRLNSIMSDYDSDSEVSQLSKKNAGEFFSVSADLFSVMKSAKHYSDISDGAFDITVGSYTKLWRRSRRQHELPKQIYLDKAKELTGNHLWDTDEKTQRIRLKKNGIKFDLGGIAKGYAIDKAFEEIQKFGIKSVLVEAGGDLRLGDAPAAGWTIQLAGDTTVHGLQNTAAASSGDTNQFIEINAERYSHIIAPKTGLGLTTPCIVNVFAPTATQADALASALSVLGQEKGIALAETQNGAAAKIILYENKKSVETKNWQKTCGGLATAVK